MTIDSSLQETEFSIILTNFKRTLTEEQQNDFRFSTLEDLEIAVNAIQKKQASEKKMRNLTRLKCFLEAMDQYGKVIEVFLNTSNFVAFIWGPTKFLLQVASTYTEAFDALLDAYQQIGESLPLLSQYQNLLERNPHMRSVLGLIYKDILEFHKKTLKYFQQRVWKQLFQATWKTFRTKFSYLLENLLRHRRLVESQANLAQFEELFQESQRARLKSEAEFQILKDGENSRRLNTAVAWLSAASTSIDQETCARKRRKYPETGRWLLGNSRVQTWFNPELCTTPLLWINGIPGAGKSVLASLIVEESQKLCSSHCVSVAFFYCKHNDLKRNTFNAIARGILIQLLRQNDALLPYLFEKASSSGESILETSSLVKELLETAIRSLGKVYIIIDGLDECERNEKKTTALWFRSLIETNLEADPDAVRCLFFSQDDGEVGKFLSKVPTIQITAENINQDVRIFASAWSKKLQTQFETSDAVREEIYSAVTGKADGMFLFARLAMKHLKSQLTREELTEELKPDKFPRGLGEVYTRIVDRILKGNGLPAREAAAKLLGWLICAKRPLKWHEIQGATSINLRDQNVDFEERRLRVSAKELCGSLVERRSDDTVELVHLTAKFFLVDQKYIKLAPVELGLVRLCLGYLSFRCFEDGVPEADINDFVLKGCYSFLDYATIHWVDHLQNWIQKVEATESVTHATDLLQNFLQKHWSRAVCNKPIPTEVREKFSRFETWEIFECLVKAVFMWKREREFYGSRTPDSDPLDLVRRIIHARNILEKMDSASKENSIAEGKLSTFYGSNLYKCPRVSCSFFADGFMTKSQRDSHLEKHERQFNCVHFGCPFGILGFKTKKDLDKHTADSHGETQNAISKFPVIQDSKSIDIRQAIRNGCEEEVEKWLQQFNGKNNFRSLYRRALQPAVAKGDISIVKLLLKSVNNMETAHISVLLNLAMRLKQDDIAFLLLDHNLADPSKNGTGGTPPPVFNAIEYGREAVFSYMIQGHGLDVNHGGGRNRTLLGEAARHGQLAMIQLLLGTSKCDINLANNCKETPIHLAAREGQEVVVRLLLGTGNCNADSKSETGETPTAYAAREGHENILRILGQQQPPPVEFDKWLGVAQLLNAARAGDDRLVRELLARGDIPADTSSSRDNMTLLTHAAEQGHSSVVEQLLVRSDVNPNRRGLRKFQYGRSSVTPLHLAVMNGHESVVRQLLARKDINVSELARHRTDTDSSVASRNALEIAQVTGQESIARLLKEYSTKVALTNEMSKMEPLKTKSDPLESSPSLEASESFLAWGDDEGLRSDADLTSVNFGKDSPRDCYSGSQSSHLSISTPLPILDVARPGALLENARSEPAIDVLGGSNPPTTSVQEDVCEHKAVTEGVCFDCWMIFPDNNLLFSSTDGEPKNSVATLQLLNVNPLESENFVYTLPPFNPISSPSQDADFGLPSLNFISPQAQYQDYAITLPGSAVVQLQEPVYTTTSLGLPLHDWQASAQLEHYQTRDLPPHSWNPGTDGYVP